MNPSIIMILLILVPLVSGCASYRPLTEVSRVSPDISASAADTALSMVGKPYKYRGESPEGFDCSGLVRYSYLSAGMEVPRSTSALKEKSRPIRAREIRKGDLVFFDQLGRKYSHVGISLGGNRFVHAPSSGKVVRVNSLDEDYWKKYFLGARRF